MMERPTREAYARGHAVIAGFECSVGIEWRGEPVDSLSAWAETIATAGAHHGDHARAVRHVEAIIVDLYPERAYFVETERAGAGVQVFQPYGLPRDS